MKNVVAMDVDAPIWTPCSPTCPTRWRSRLSRKPPTSCGMPEPASAAGAGAAAACGRSLRARLEFVTPSPRTVSAPSGTSDPSEKEA